MRAARLTNVRAVRAGDVDGVVALVTRVLAEFDIRFGEGSDTDEALRDLPQSYADRGGAFWVAVEADLEGPERVVGTVGVARISDTQLELRKMYLDPASRGRGLGQRLLDTAIAWAETSGAAILSLDTTHEMTAAQALYEKNGFVRDDRYIVGSRCNRGYALRLGQRRV